MSQPSELHRYFGARPLGRLSAAFALIGGPDPTAQERTSLAQTADHAHSASAVGLFKAVLRLSGQKASLAQFTVLADPLTHRRALQGPPNVAR